MTQSPRPVNIGWLEACLGEARKGVTCDVKAQFEKSDPEIPVIGWWLVLYLLVGYVSTRRTLAQPIDSSWPSHICRSSPSLPSNGIS